MKHVSGILQKLTTVVAVAAALSSCNRAEYAALPKTSSYHGTQYVAAKPKEAPVATPAEAPAPAPAAVAIETPATAPVAQETLVATVPATKAAATTVRKPTLVQRLVLNKVVKKAGKLASKAQLKPRSETANATRIEGKLRQGLLLLLAGIVIELLGALTNLGVIYILGAIVAVVGIIFIILYLLDAV